MLPSNFRVPNIDRAIRKELSRIGQPSEPIQIHAALLKKGVESLKATGKSFLQPKWFSNVRLSHSDLAGRVIRGVKAGPNKPETRSHPI